MTSLARRVGVVEEKVDRLDRLEAAVDRYVQEGACEREEARRQRDADREEAQRRNEKFEQFMHESVRERRETNRKWGEASDRIGRFAENIVAPSVRRMAHEVFECGEPLCFIERVERARAGDRARMREFDAFYVGTEKVLLNETKSTPRDSDVRRFAKFVRDRELNHYFPEYRAMPVVAVFSSLHMPEGMVSYLTRQGIYALAVGDEVMDVLNLDAVRRRQRCTAAH